MAHHLAQHRCRAPSAQIPANSLSGLELVISRPSLPKSGPLLSPFVRSILPDHFELEFFDPLRIEPLVSLLAPEK
jgi:hypothetical protein